MRVLKHKCSPEGGRIRRLRMKSGMSQEDLARRVGVTTHTIWRLENGGTFNPRLDTLRAIAKALGVGVVALITPPP
jgi:transcriptional regulator with XRE-family HTH domain